jgi:hypothetical protein
MDFVSLASKTKIKLRNLGSVCDITRNGTVIGQAGVMIVSKSVDLTDPLVDTSKLKLMLDNTVALETGDKISGAINAQILNVSPLSPDGVTVIYYEVIGA